MADLVLTAKPFQLVNFIRPGRCSVTRCVDITLLQWIRFDEVKNKFVTKYMPGPYNDETNEILYDLIKKKAAASQEWPEYSIKIIGHADTYETAVERLNILKIREFAYTSDSDVNVEEKRDRLQSLIKEIGSSSADLKEILKVPKLSDTDITTFHKSVPDPLALEEMEIDTDTSMNNMEQVGSFGNKRKKKSVHKQNPSSKEYYVSETDEENLEDQGNDSVCQNPRFYELKASLQKHSKKNKDSEVKAPFIRSNKNTQGSEFKNIKKKRSGHNFLHLKENLNNDTDEEYTEDHSNTSTDRNSICHKVQASLQKPSKTNKAPNVKAPHPSLKENGQEYNREVLKELKLLRVEVWEIAEGQKIIKTMLENEKSSKYVSKKSFQEEFSITYPLNGLQDFQNLNEKLQKNEECCHRLKSSLDLSMSKDAGVRKSLILIFKKIFTRDLLMTFTSVKKIEGKEVFKEFYLCTCLLDVACSKFNVTEEEVLSHISTVIANAKDWGGHRKERR